ncbi:MAG: hypothetical protein HOF19_06650 [Gammaproteobacteria bacterium]|nr:hypothetical protein [Gammaproteobacteria bacterium]
MRSTIRKSPKPTQTYLNHHLDSSRWEVYEPQDGDIVMTTSYKCGTTFTQQILYNMLVRNTAGDREKRTTVKNAGSL